MAKLVSRYQAPQNSWWQGRVDSEIPERIHQNITLKNIDEVDFTLNHKHCILGFASDEGVKRNKGRTGAAAAPIKIREKLASMAWHKETPLADGGNIGYTDNNLEESQEEMSELVSRVLSKNTFPIVLGGGHETALPSYMGLRKQVKEESIGIINFDAHFDLRPVSPSASSGTPFRQIAEHCSSNNHAFNYLCLGIQKSGNTTTLFDKAKKEKVQFITDSQFCLLQERAIIKRIEDFCALFDHLYLTIDMDVFHSSYTPGVSAANAFGIDLFKAFPIIHSIFKNEKLRLFDITEVNPSLDIDDRTSKLAARLVYEKLTILPT